jgi:hypothetical protein
MNSTMPSLMDDLDRVAAPAKSSAPREPLGTRLRARLTDWWDGRMSSPGKKKTTYAGGAVLLNIIYRDFTWRGTWQATVKTVPSGHYPMQDQPDAVMNVLRTFVR